MAKTPTLEQIVAMTPEARRALYKNARKLDTDEARGIVALIGDNRLLASNSGGLPREDPLIVAIETIVQSTEGREAAKAAADAGLPAMAGVDQLLRAQVGEEYGMYDTTSWAGTFVATEMESMGYRQTGKKALPEGSVAKAAAFFVRSS